MAADQGIIDTVSMGNLKTIAESAAFYAAQGFADHQAHRNRLNILAESAVANSQMLGQSALGGLIKNLQTVTPVEAQADATLDAGGIGQLLSTILGALNGGQIGTKVAQTTPPVYVDPTSK